MAESSNSILVQEDGISTLHGSMKVDGNLEVGTQLTAHELKIVGSDNTTWLSTANNMISFRKACNFLGAAQFANGRTIIGMETTYNSAYVGTETLQAGQRIVVGDSLFKITADERKIIADTFRMTLARLNVDNLISKKEYANSIEAKNVKVTEELIGQNIYADTIKTNKLFLDSIGSRNLQSTETITAKDLVVDGTATIENDVVIRGTGVGPNGAALTVNGGEIVANEGIVSHTGNNIFQTMQIMGDGENHNVCFKVDPDVDSLFEGDVTIENSKLVLDNSKLVTDNIVVTPLSEVQSDDPLSGVMLTTQSNWETYKQGMVVEAEPDDIQQLDEDEYDPVAVVEAAIERNENNYEIASRTVKTIVNPISYLMEKKDSSIPKKFNIKDGIYRIDSNGNALTRNLVAERGTFSQLNAYKFNVNRLAVDKLITTAVASKVVHADQLLKSKTLAEFDGSVNVGADVFMESGSSMNVANGAKVTFQNGAELTLKSGSKLEMGTGTSMKMSGDVELDLNKLVFLDSNTGKRYRIYFSQELCDDGAHTVMNYEQVQETPKEVVERTELDARELDRKLKSLGI